jgi:hypothetical protein
VEDIADLIEGLILQPIKVEYFSICRLLDEDRLSVFVLITAIDIVVESEFSRRRDLFSLLRLLYSYMFPFLLSVVLLQVKVNFVKALVDCMGNDRL